MSEAFPTRAELIVARNLIRRANRVQRQRIKDAKPARVEKAGQEPRKREPAYLGWIRRLPCLACVIAGVEQTSTTEAAHCRSGYPQDGWRPTGMQERPHDRRCTPLCGIHHRYGPDAQHGASERRWWDAIGIHPPALCAALSAAFDADADGAAVIHQFAKEART